MAPDPPAPAGNRPLVGAAAPGGGAVDFGPAMAVADAVLYEGYLLYPYRGSSPKNRVRWQFGVLAPRRWIDARPGADEGVAGSAESWWSQAECLLLEERPGAAVELRLRYLRLDGGSTGGMDQAVPGQMALHQTVAALCTSPAIVDTAAAGGTADGDGDGDGEPMTGRLSVSAERLAGRRALTRLTIRVENTTGAVDPDLQRDAALWRAMVATHVLVGVTGGAFVSALDPPAWARAHAGTCRNVRLFPVLAGPEGSTDLLLAAPIILYDHPKVAPESPGDLFDATEIDEILSLRTLTLSDEEKAEARATDPRAAELLDRVEGMRPEVFGRLHGAVRSLGRPGGGSEPTAGRASIPVGAQVRLRPRSHGTDAQDMFLVGRTATVVSVLTDVDGSEFVAVTLDGDPRSAVEGGPGRLRHFAPDEVELVADGPTGDGASGTVAGGRS